VVFQNHLTGLIQDAVMAGTISQIQTDGQLGLFENLVSLCCHGAILFHKPVSFVLRLERVDHWERIASRRRLAFSSHLINGIIGMWESVPIRQKATFRHIGT
jgi:hypothetical protein